MDNEKTKILIADDEAGIRDAVKAILLSEDYDVIVARNGKEAVAMFKKESPEMVILDVNMPYLTGIQVLAKIKRFFGERYIPVIFLTVSVKIDDKLKALSGGAVDYLTKPVSPEELLARIRNFLEIKERHDQLKAAAVYDWMTGVLNKEHFLRKAREELAKAVRNKTPLSFIFMDIDGFKKINDEIGHMAGDLVISEFGIRLKKIVRNIDLLGRFGGDEFMVMLPHKGKKEANVVAARIDKITKGKPVVFERRKIHITISQGVVSIESNKDLTIDNMIKLADEGLYQAKDKGGNCYVAKHIS